MGFSGFTLLMSVLCFSLASLVFCVLRRSNRFLICFSAFPLMVLVGFGIFRLFAAVELPHVYIVNSYGLLPRVVNFLRTELTLGVFSIKIRTLILIIWAVGSIIIYSEIISAHIRFVRRIRALPDTSDTRIAPLLERILDKHGANVKFRVVVHSGADCPMIVGFRNPVIMLPDYELSDEMLEYALIHECTHFLGKDMLLKLFVQTVCCLLWWNPLVYLLIYDLDHALEIRCDIKVISDLNKTQRVDYYSMLYRIATCAKLCSKERTTVFSSNTITFNRIFLWFKRKDERLLQRCKVGLEFDTKKPRRQLYNAVLCVVITSVFIASYLVLPQSATINPVNTGRVSESVSYDSLLLPATDSKFEKYVISELTETIQDRALEPFTRLPLTSDFFINKGNIIYEESHDGIKINDMDFAIE